MVEEYPKIRIIRSVMNTMLYLVDEMVEGVTKATIRHEKVVVDEIFRYVLMT